MTIDAKTFWRTLGQRPTGVTIVTANGVDGPSGFLGLSASHVTADPPTMLVSIDDRTAALSAVLHNRHFAVNFLSNADQDIADLFGGKSNLKGADRFVSDRWTTLSTGAPVLKSALGVIDCSLVEAFRYNTTTIAVGNVAALTPQEGDPLIFFRGQYRGL